MAPFVDGGQDVTSDTSVRIRVSTIHPPPRHAARCSPPVTHRPCRVRPVGACPAPPLPRRQPQGCPSAENLAYPPPAVSHALSEVEEPVEHPGAEPQSLDGDSLVHAMEHP